MGGEAIAILLGKFNPSAKLPMSFPRSIGQIPIYYNQLNTGRPDHTRWTDSPLSPLYPFGFGLSYTTFEDTPN
jgi:beta-glucosidase